jgi:hypothetical protein
MATFEQDLIIFEDDTLLLRYTFNDLEDTFDTQWGVWWGAYPYASFPPSTPPAVPPTIQKHTDWTVSSGGPLLDTNDIAVVNADTIINVTFNQTDFIAGGGSLLTDTEYYTELVVSPNQNESTSVVAATGKLYISSSMFSIAGYRP